MGPLNTSGTNSGMPLCLSDTTNWIGSLSEKSLYKHLLESLNHASEETEGESIIDDLTEADMELELGQIEVNDAHLADALAGLSDDEFQ
jgi:hypothetical protein